MYTMTNDTMPTNDLNWNEIMVIVTIMTAIIGGITFIIARIFKLGRLSQRLETLEGDTKEIRKDIKGLGRDLTKRIDEILNINARKDLAESHSPMQLSGKGKKVLKSSGIDAVVDDRFEMILDRVKKLKPKNPYQAEQAVFNVVSELENDPVTRDAIEEGAFNSGFVKGSVLFVGGLYIRDRILEKLNFNVDDIDKHNPAKGSAT